MLLQPTSPFRNYQHIRESIEKFEKNIESFDFLVSMTEATKNSTLIKQIEEDGSLKNYDLDFSNYKRQNYKEYYPNGAIFIGKNKEYLEKKHFFGERSLAYFMTKEDSVDIDDKLDFEFAILLMNMKQKEKQLLKNIENRIEEKKEKFSETKDITLIGHSILDNWNIENFGKYSVNNLGIRGISTIQYNNMILNKNMISKLGKYVFLMAGTNDIVIKNWKKEDTLLWINETLSKINKLNKDCKIFFIEVPKVISRADRNNKVIEELNTYLKKELKDKVHYISLKDLEDKFGNLNLEYTYDGLHFNDKGYSKLVEILEKEIEL